jgi:hypothetical protein
MEKEEYKGGVQRPEVTTSIADPVRARVAKKTTTSYGGHGRNRNAGMMIDFINNPQHNTSGYKLDAYRTSYANGLDQRSGTYDVPTYFVTMNEQNGGVLYWPVTLAEKYSWYRYFIRSDAYVGRGIEILTDLPMSKLTLNMTKECPEKMRDEVFEFFEYQMEHLDLYNLCRDILWDWNSLGNVFLFVEWNEKMKWWENATMLPPEEVSVFELPFTKKKRVEYRPERLLSIIKSSIEDNTEYSGFDCDGSNLQQEIVENLPQDLVDMVKENGCIVMDSDPSTGSFAHVISKNKSRYHDLGASVLERVLVPMLQKEHYRYTQLSLASRNMTPKNIVYAEGLLPHELDDLRMQIDLSYLDPDYTIVANYPVNWEMIGANDRLLQLDSEYERIENQIFAALGVTRELLTGEGSFSGNKITVELLNTMFIQTRQVLIDFVEKQLFKPIAEAHGWLTEGKNGIKKYWYPKVGFNRLTIRDNAEVFDSLYQLYQKGSLPVNVIYELFNLNSEEMARILKEDLFTVKDSTFNRSIEEINSETGRAVAERTDIAQKVSKYLGLKYEEPPPEDDGGFGGGFGDEGGDFGGFETADVPEASGESLDGVADALVEELPNGSTIEDVEDIVNNL